MNPFSVEYTILILIVERTDKQYWLVDAYLVPLFVPNLIFAFNWTAPDRWVRLHFFNLNIILTIFNIDYI